MIGALFDRPWKRTLWVTLLLAILTVIYTFPLVLSLASEIPGKGGDLSQYYWSHWWFQKALERGTNPWHTDMLWYPNGTSLVFNTNRFGSALLAVPLTPVAGSVASYNLVILLSFVVSGLGVFLLVRELSGSEAGAIAAAVVFAFNPFKLNKLIYHHFLLSTYTFGFAFWMLLRILRGRKKSRLNAVFLGLLVAATAYESIFYLDLLLLTLLALAAWYALFERKEFWRRQTLLPLLLAALTAAVAAAPMIAITVADLHEYGRLPRAAGSAQFSNDLLVLFAPSPMPFSNLAEHPERIFSSDNFVYNTPEENFGIIGWPVLALAVAGYLLNRKRHAAVRAAAAGALTFAVLSLGPFLQVGGSNQFFTVESIGTVRIPLPYVFLQFFPPIGMVRTPSRFIILTFLFLAILTGFALGSIRKRLKRKWALVPTLLVALVFIDYFPHGISTTNPTAVPRPVKELADLDGDFGVIPFGIGYVENMRHGAAHGKPQTAGYVSRGTLYSRPLQDFSVLMLRGLSHFAVQHPESPRLEAMSSNVRKVLNGWGIGAVLHKGKEKQSGLLAALLEGKVLSRENDISLILLPRPRPAGEEGLTIDTGNWPRMPDAGLEGGASARFLTTGEGGFRICVPDSLMPRGEIVLTAWSAVRSIPRRAMKLIVFVNRIEVATWKLAHQGEVLRINIPLEIPRLPVNIIAIRPRLERIKKREGSFPFAVDAVSGNVGAGSTAALRVGDKVVMPARYRGATINVAILRGGGNGLDRLTSFPVGEGSAGAAAAAMLGSLKQNEWALVFTSGIIGQEEAEALARALKRLGLKTKPGQINRKSYIALISGKTGKGSQFSSAKGALHLVVNSPSVPVGPVVNLQTLRFR